jgi:hypothetical protein
VEPPDVTAEALSAVLCLASGIFGRPAWDLAKCAERAAVVLAAAARHGVDPLLMVALDVHECELREKDVPVYKVIGEREVLAGYDACPMGVRVMGVDRRALYDDVALYELAASRLEHWKRWCGRGHPGGRYRAHLPARHHYVAHYNQGNPTYSNQVLAVLDALRGRFVQAEARPDLTSRTADIVRRYQKIYRRRRS